MSDLTTKQKIINASIQLFNEHGMANVRLQQIAKATGISTGNLAYHFKNKEAVIDMIGEQILDQATEILSAYRRFPNLSDFDFQLTIFFEFIQKYPFYYIDLVEIKRQHSQIQKDRNEQISKFLQQIRKRFDFNIQRGIIKPEPFPEYYQYLTESIWVNMTFWIPQNKVRKTDQSSNIHAFKKMVWQQIYPSLTRKGQREYEELISPSFIG